MDKLTKNKYYNPNQTKDQKIWPNRYDLEQLDVLIDDTSFDPQFFDLKLLPEHITYGRTAFTIGIKNPLDSEYRLRDGSSMLVEVKDVEGKLIYVRMVKINFDEFDSAEKIQTKESSLVGNTLGYIEISTDPLGTYEEISDGMGTLTIVGELDGVPEDWKNTYNVRYTKQISIKKKLNNLAPVVFQNNPIVETTVQTPSQQSSIAKRGLSSTSKNLHFLSVEDLHSYGGELKYVEISYDSDKEDLRGHTLYDTSEVDTHLMNLFTISSSKAVNNIPMGNFNNARPATSISSNSYRTFYSGSGHSVISHNSLGEPTDTGVTTKWFSTFSLYGNNTTPTTTTLGMPSPVVAPGGAVGIQQGFRAGLRVFSSNPIRRTVEDEWYTVGFNITGSGRFTVRYAYPFGSGSSAKRWKNAEDALMSSGSHNKPGEAHWFAYGTSSNDTSNFYMDNSNFDYNHFYRRQEWPDTEYVKTAWVLGVDEFNPELYRNSGSFINGVYDETKPSNWLNYSNGKDGKDPFTGNSGSNNQIIREDFLIPSGTVFAWYWCDEKGSSGNENAKSAINNVTIQFKKQPGQHPPLYFRTLDLPARATRDEKIEFKLKFLNSNMETAVSIDNIDQPYYDSSSVDYKSEAFQIERGLGSGEVGYESNSVISTARFRTVVSGSNWAINAVPIKKDGLTQNYYSASIGVIAESAEGNYYDGFNRKWSAADKPGSPPLSYKINSSQDRRARIMGGKFVAIKTVTGSVAVGLEASAFMSGANNGIDVDYSGSITGNELWAARFNNGNVYIQDNLYVSGSINAFEYHLTEVTQSTLFATGSTRFGDSPNDTHTFTGSLFVTHNGFQMQYGRLGSAGWIDGLSVNGAVSASNGVFYGRDINIEETGSFAHISSSGGATYANNIDVDNTGSFGYLIVNGDITASGDLYLDKRKIYGTRSGPNESYIDINSSVNKWVLRSAGRDNFESGFSQVIVNSGNEDVDFIVKGDNKANLLRTNAGLDRVGINTLTPGELFTVNGAISSSAGIYAESASINQNLITSHITSSGFISASNTIYAKNLILSGGLGVFTSESLAAGGGGGGSMTSFQLEDDSGDEVTISDAKEVKFIGSGITTNWTDTDNGTDGDPYDMTFTVDSAQTGISSIFNTSLVVGHDVHNFANYGTDNVISFNVDDAERLNIKPAGLSVNGHVSASANITASLTGSFGNVHIDDSLTGLGIGNDNDLLLYHDGSHSYIKDNGTGNLYYRGGTQTFQNAAGTKTMVVLNAANSVDLHYNDDKKFETAPLGINVTGRVHATTHISASGNITASGAIFTENIQSPTPAIHQGVSPSSRTAGLTIANDLDVRSHITASANITASGVYYGKQREHTYHQYNNDSSTSALFIPAPGAYVIESTVVNYYRQWLAPYDGELIKVKINFENDPGATRLYLYINGTPTHRKSVTSSAGMNTYDMTSTDVGARSTFDEGNILALTVDPANAPGDVNLVCTWQYEIND